MESSYAGRRHHEPLVIDTVVLDPRQVGLTVHGELDALTAPQLTEAVTRTVTVLSPDLVELNLAAVEFIDSTGLRCLLEARALARAAGAGLVVDDPSPAVRRALEITGLLSLLVPPTTGAGAARSSELRRGAAGDN